MDSEADADVFQNTGSGVSGIDFSGDGGADFVVNNAAGGWGSWQGEAAGRCAEGMVSACLSDAMETERDIEACSRYDARVRSVRPR